MNNRYYDINTNNSFLYGKVSKIVKGVSHMKNENIKLQSAKALANASCNLEKFLRIAHAFTFFTNRKCRMNLRN